MREALFVFRMEVQPNCEEESPCSPDACYHPDNAAEHSNLYADTDAIFNRAH